MKVLLAGTARSGSTWAANVMGHAVETRVVHEPDCPTADVLGAMAGGRLGEYPVLSADERSRTYNVVWNLAFAGGWPWDRVEGARVVGRRMVKIPPALRDAVITGLAVTTARLRSRPQNVVVKSVNCAFSLDWISRRYRPTVVILRRNPLNVVSSWAVLGMGEDASLAENPRIAAEYLAPKGLTPPHPNGSLVTRAAWIVGLQTLALKAAAERHPDWIVASHDDLCVDPQDRFRALFERIGLGWSAAADAYLRTSDTPGFVAHGGTAGQHPNAVTATLETTSRRAQQATQYARRLSEDQVLEARTVLDAFRLGEWGPS